MTHQRNRSAYALPHEEPLDEDERSLWTLDDLYELSTRLATPLDHEIVAHGDGADFPVPPPPHGASWDPI